MIRTITVSLAVLALASAAQAESITINVAGKDAATIHADIRQAARTLCWSDMTYSPLALEMMRACTRSTVAAAEVKAAEILATRAPPSQAVALQERQAAAR